MEQVKAEGYVEKIVFRNEENGYTVFSMSVAGTGEELPAVGNFSYIAEGQYLIISGHVKVHKEYGPQVCVDSYEERTPQSAAAMEKYLGSGAIKGVGPALAARIVKKFGDKTFEIMDETPEKLSEVKGISPKSARNIAKQFFEKRKLRKAMIFLQQYNIPMNLSVKIYKQYGEKTYDVIQKNPYKIAEDISGAGFRTADAVAHAVGISPDSQFRVKAGLLYTLSLAGNNGHCYLPESRLISETASLLMIDPAVVENSITGLLMDKDITAVEGKSGEKLIYSTYMYNVESGCARMLCDLNLKFEIDRDELMKEIDKFEKAENIQLDKMQIIAVTEAVSNGITIITGGPGTGKTTTINTIINLLEGEGLDILLAAPTGRAAKRMTEATGHEARTIHRLLEIDASPDEEGPGMKFQRNERNPLESDVIIIDEMSMVDIYLFNSLLKAIVPGTRLIMAGDSSQLPSVGPGNVLKDMINAGFCNVVKLDHIFRQAAQSDIVLNAHAVNSGEKLRLDNKSRDFFMLRRDSTRDIINVVLQLVVQKMPAYVNADMYDIQVLTPMKKGELGVDHMNTVLQKFMNPPDPSKKEHEFHGILFRENDKIMQTKNDYQAQWHIYDRYHCVTEEGKGVFNGDTGVIKKIDEDAATVTVSFEDNREVEYDFTDMDEIMLSYAITIHKSQGSEYPAVVIPILSGPKLLFNRNLLYTAITRAKKCVVIVGSEDMLHRMAANTDEQKRFSGLEDRIRECSVEN